MHTDLEGPPLVVLSDHVTQVDEHIVQVCRQSSVVVKTAVVAPDLTCLTHHPELRHKHHNVVIECQQIVYRQNYKTHN